MEQEQQPQNTLEIIVVKNQEGLDFNCKICNLPLCDPIQCEACQNIYCYNCIVDYIFVNRSCPSDCKVNNLVKIGRIFQQNIQESALIQCYQCAIKINPLQFQNHLSKVHQYQFQKIDSNTKLNIPPAKKMNDMEKSQYLQHVNNLINIEESQNEEVLFAMKCSICLKYLNEESSQCFSCENVWCTQCVRKLEYNNNRNCFNRCSPQNFILMQQDFKQKYFNKYKAKCEECGEWLKVEDHTYHLKNIHQQQINQDPNLANLYLKYARYYYKKEQYENSKQYCAQGLSYDYSNTSLWFNKALSLTKLGKIKEAILYFRESIKIEEDAPTYYNIGVNLKRLDLIEEAIEIYKKALSLDPNYYQAYNNLGCCLHDQGKLDEALSMFDECIKINQNYSNVYDSKASALFDKKQIDEAFQLYQKSIELDTNYYYAYLGKAKCQYYFGNYEQALQDAKIFLEKQEKEHDQANDLILEIQKKLQEQSIQNIF